MEGTEELKQRLVDNGYEDVVVFENYGYETAFIGVTNDNRAVYDYDLMVEYLMEKEGWSWEDAVEWIDYNTLRSLAYYGDGSPVVMYKLVD